MKAALGRLAAAGLVSFLDRRGRCNHGRLRPGRGTGRSADCVEGTARGWARQTLRQEGPVWDAAYRIVDRFRIGLPPLSGLVQAGEACTRLDLVEVEHRIVVKGSLAQAPDPMAVLTGRPWRISEDLMSCWSVMHR